MRQRAYKTLPIQLFLGSVIHVRIQ